MNNINLFETIQSEIDEILVSNNFNIDDVYNNIKLITIEHAIDYYYNKASVEELIDIITEAQLKISLLEMNNLDKFIRSGSNDELLNYIKNSDLNFSALNYTRSVEIFRKLGTDVLFRYKSDENMFSKLKNIADNIVETKGWLSAHDGGLRDEFIKAYKELNILDPSTPTSPLITFTPSNTPPPLITSTSSNTPPRLNTPVPHLNTPVSKLPDVAKDFNIDPQDHSIWWTLGKWAILISIIWIVFDRSKNALMFVYYKYHIEKLLNFFKRNDYFSIKTTNRLLDYDYKFQTCADYGRLKTPALLTYSQDEYFKVRICFSKYIGSTFLYLMKMYKDYLKFKGINLTNIRINAPKDLIMIRDERININIRDSLFQMDKIINVFLDEHYKQKLLILFKLTISDNFDINRFEFDDFK